MKFCNEVKSHPRFKGNHFDEMQCFVKINAPDKALVSKTKLLINHSNEQIVSA